MKGKVIALAVSAVALSGCALPLPVKVAMWVLDGASYVATEKTIPDHGISLVAQQDCAVLRAIKDGVICRDADAGVMVAEVEPEKPVPEEVAPPLDALAEQTPVKADPEAVEDLEYIEPTEGVMVHRSAVPENEVDIWAIDNELPLESVLDADAPEGAETPAPPVPVIADVVPQPAQVIPAASEAPVVAAVSTPSPAKPEPVVNAVPKRKPVVIAKPIVPAPVLVVARQDVNMRSRPSGRSRVVRPLLRDQLAEVVGDRNGWVRVRAANGAGEGWVDGRYLDEAG